jgi:ATP-binding cassette subfamily B protein
VVGESGAGKSSLCGLLLGWQRATEGSVRIDGRELAGEALATLRQETAWIDPEVQLWNRSLAENVRYGSGSGRGAALGELCEAADLHALLPRLVDGLATPLGESGRLVSGGEGQRVRLARALGREAARLALLDEPFRGLDRVQRQRLLDRARGRFRDATLLYVTHKIAEARQFERVLVIEDGRVLEDGAPRTLAEDPSSRFRALLERERACAELWEDGAWRRLRLEDGRLQEGDRCAAV